MNRGRLAALTLIWYRPTGLAGKAILQVLNVHYLPQFVAEAELAESTVVVVDLLRASTTICYALANGADWVSPFLEVEYVLRAASEYDPDDVVLGGERGGQLIQGFDLGNSPREYTAGEVFGRTVLFTTTNGTRALRHARLASRIIVGAAVNRRAVIDALHAESRIDILCAGTGGNVTREDVLAAGALTDEFSRAGFRRTNEWADASLREWSELLNAATAMGKSASEQLAEELKSTPGGKNLIAIGQDDDLPVCAELDVLEVVPEQERETGRIRLP